MDNRSKIISMIGMANKAKKIVSGEESVRSSIRMKKVKLVIVTEDASYNTKKRFSYCAHYYNIPYCFYLNKDEMAKSIGGKIRSVIGVIDENFSNQIKKLIDSTLETKTGGELFE